MHGIELFQLFGASTTDATSEKTQDQSTTSADWLRNASSLKCDGVSLGEAHRSIQLDLEAKVNESTLASTVDFGSLSATPITWDAVVNNENLQHSSDSNDVKHAESFHPHRAHGKIKSRRYSDKSTACMEPICHRRFDDDYTVVQPEPTKVPDNAKPISKTTSDKHYMLGAEIALAAIIASVGTSRVRSMTDSSRTESTERSKATCGQEVIPPANPAFARGSDHASRSIHTTSDNENQNDQNKHACTAPTVRPKTLIAATDTLISIAEAFFHDANVAWLIADINRPVLKETWVDGKRIIETKSRQSIELPLWSEIADFYSSRSKEATPENLITIVEQSVVDIELLNSVLGKIVDSRRIPTIQTRPCVV